MRLMMHLSYPPMSKANSLENINLQFRSIMGKMGLDEEKQNKLSHKLDLSKKIKTIISMQTLEERKKKIGEYLERISHTQSLMSMLSLHCSIENGNKTLFSIFMNSRGREIILSTVESMEGEYASAVLDFILMLLLKYSWEVPHLLEGILKRYVEVKFKSETFFGIVEYYVKRGEYEILFKKTTPFGCICNCYLSLILKESVIEKEKEGRSVKDNSVQDNSVQDNSPKVNSLKVNSVQDNSLKVNSLKDSTVTHFPSHLNFLTLLKEGPKKEIVNYIESVYKKKRSIKVKECKSERLYEILRIAEEKKMLDVVTCVVESVVEGEYKDSSKDIRDIRDSSTVGDKNVKDIKDNVKDKDTVQSPTSTPSLSPTSSSTPSLSPTVPSHSLPSTKKKIIKRIVKKTILKPYEQFKWIKIQKKGTIFEGVEGVEVKEEDLTPFLKKDTPPPSLPPSTLKKESVFTEKKSYALNIALSRIKLTDRDLKEKILSLSPEINPNLIKQLLLYFPTEEEREGLSKGDSRDRDKGVRGRKGDHIKDRGFIDRDKDISPSSTPPPTGSRAVSFFKECLPQLDSLKNALSLLNFKSLLSSLNILSQLDTLSLYYRTILSSTPLRRILGTLLSLGNALNKGTPLGQAEAFAFESLPSLLTKTTLSFLRKRVDVSLFREEFKILYEVQRLSHESLSVDYKEVSTAYEKVEDIPPGVEEKYKEIEDKYKETEKYLKKAQEYLKEKIDEEFNKLFLEMYKRVCNEEKGG